MATQASNSPVPKMEITFPNGHRAQVVMPPWGTPARDILNALGITQPKMLILVTGSAGSLDQLDAAAKSRLIQLFSRGIARAAATTGALIIDGGTQSGVMRMMGHGVADRGHQSSLLGVAPAGKIVMPDESSQVNAPDCVPLDPNHTHFVLVQGKEWGDETDTLFDLGAALAARTLDATPAPDGKATGLAKGAAPKIPIANILAGGNVEGVSKSEALHCVRRGWPLIVIEGSGGLADEIVTRLKDRTQPLLDPDLAEIVEDGRIHVFAAERSVGALQQLLVRQLEVTNVLALAWQQFAVYDENAKRHQKSFNQTEKAILGLGLLTTTLVLAQTIFGSAEVWKKTFGFFGSDRPPFPVDQPLHLLVVILPILTSILLAARNRFNPGSKWVVLRGSAEAIKRDIFRYRTIPPEAGPVIEQPAIGDANKQPESPDQQAARPATREMQLASRLEFINRQVEQSNVNVSALRRYVGPIPPKWTADPGDDAFSPLTPEQYVKYRLDNQLGYYQKKTVELEGSYRRLQWAVLIVGGLGTLLAAINQELWVALTTAIVTALTTYLGYQQIENSLIQYNQLAANLQSVKGWWTALSGEEQADSKNIASLVETTEKMLESELTGWVQQMHDALAELRTQKEGKKASGGTQTQEDGAASDGESKQDPHAPDATSGGFG